MSGLTWSAVAGLPLTGLALTGPAETRLAVLAATLTAAAQLLWVSPGGRSSRVGRSHPPGGRFSWPRGPRLLNRMRSWSRALRPGPRRRRHADIEREVLAVVEAVVAELRSGAPAVVALTRAVHDVPPGVLPRALDGLSGRLALDGDPTVAIDVLDEAAGTPGGEGLVALAACLRVAGATGAGLASGLTQVGADLRDDQALRAEMSAALAGPRATAKLLAGLPVFGLLLGSGIGADPVRVLLGTPAGWVCLAVGVPLQVLGWRWMERLADRADPTYWLTRASRRGERL